MENIFLIKNIFHSSSNNLIVDVKVRVGVAAEVGVRVGADVKVGADVAVDLPLLGHLLLLMPLLTLRPSSLSATSTRPNTRHLLKYFVVILLRNKYLV